MGQAIVLKRYYKPDESAQDELLVGLLRRLTPTDEVGPSVRALSPDASRAESSDKTPMRPEHTSTSTEGQ